MLKPTSLVIDAGLSLDVACLTDGRFNGGSHGFCIGHITPEAQVDGPIALVRDGDVIHVYIVKNIAELRVPEEELERRRGEWKPLPIKVNQVPCTSTLPYGGVGRQQRTYYGRLNIVH